jgi:carboxylate-amine ligase
MEHNFRAGFTLGIEEELLLVDRDTHALSHTSHQLLGAMDVDTQSARHDLYEAQVELSSPICADAAEAAAALGGLRRSVRDAGGTPMGAGIHPAAELGDVRITQQPRYTQAAALLGGVVHRTPDCALHVHVGMPDPDAAIRACNGLREHLPLLHALAANSAYWYGQDARLASARFVLRRGFPRVEVPRAFRDFEDFEQAIEPMLAAAELEDYTSLWWDVRPHPRLGTAEVRVMDAQSSLESLTGLAALVHGLAVHEAVSGRREWIDREPIEEAVFSATSRGLDARLLDGDGRMRPVRELAREAMELARPHLADMGASVDALEGVERILDEGGGADRQRAAHAAGGMPALLQMLVDETAG